MVVRHESIVGSSDAAGIGENTHPRPPFLKPEVNVVACL